MQRLYEWTSRFLGATAVALLVVSVLLVPQGRALADDGGGGVAQPCVQQFNCDHLQLCFTAQNCVPTGVDWCSKTSDPLNCGGCRCVPIVSDCQCKP